MALWITHLDGCVGLKKWISHCGSQGKKQSLQAPDLANSTLTTMKKLRLEKQHHLYLEHVSGFRSTQPAAFTSLLSRSDSEHSCRVSWMLSSWLFSRQEQHSSGTSRLNLNTGPPVSDQDALRGTHFLIHQAHSQAGAGNGLGPASTLSLLWTSKVPNNTHKLEDHWAQGLPQVETPAKQPELFIPPPCPHRCTPHPQGKWRVWDLWKSLRQGKGSFC